MKYLESVTKRNHGAVRRFLLHVLYSLHCTTNFKAKKLYLAEHTTAIAVGEEGMRELDDVRCFPLLYESLSTTFTRMSGRVMWLLVAHMLRPPGALSLLLAQKEGLITAFVSDSMATNNK